MKYAMIIVFVATFAIAFACGFADATGHRDFAEAYLGPLFLILWGTLFAGAMALCIYKNTPASMIFFGEVSRDRKPMAYYSVLGVIFLIGLGVFITGTVLLIRNFIK